MVQEIVAISLSGLVSVFAAAPSSTNFNLKAFEVGGGGGGSTSSTNFSLNIVTGEQSGGRLSSTNYVIGSGETPTQNANVTPPPAVTNPASFYNKLQIILDTGSNPSDTRYLIAISSDSFATTLYVQTDNGIGPGLSITNYQTYTSWGGGSGFEVLGLNPSTTYQVKVKALQGDFTESAYSDVGSAATVNTTLSFSVATSLTPTPPLIAAFPSLPANTVTDASASMQVSFATNAVNGGSVYIRSANTGLTSTNAAATIGSATADLSIASSGYGAQVTSSTQSLGGPFTASAPFNLGAANVGGLSALLTTIVSTAGPVTAGNGVILLKAKSSPTTPSSNDYTDTITLVAVGLF